MSLPPPVRLARSCLPGPALLRGARKATARRLRPAPRFSWLLLFSLGVAGIRGAAAPQFTTPDQTIQRIVELMDQRLAVMPEVASWKSRRGQPVVDAERERQVITQSVADASALGLEPTAARGFFEVQIRLARAVQITLLEGLKPGETLPPGRNLTTELRPVLDAIGRDLLPALYLASGALAARPPPELRTAVASLRRHPGITDELLADLARALGATRLTGVPTLAIIQRAGYLRVGTTGDYAPFSSDAGGNLRGLEIALVEALAREWRVTPVYFRTSWPALMGDLQSSQFDLAASGITDTAERRRRAEFSVAYHVDGKTPIARRADARRFDSLEKIDQPGVRVIVNPGGTNERFVRENLHRATVTVHPDNRTVFAEIVAGRADVMITDGIEVQLQVLRHPELAGTMPQPLTPSGKAMLLPPGSDLTPRINAWLTPRIEQGEIARLITRALAEAK